MTVNTKFNVNDEVWFIDDDNIICDKVIRVNFENCKVNGMSITYDFKELDRLSNFRRFRKEDKVFRTKQELIKSL